MWGRIYENMAEFSKASMNPGFVQDQNEHHRMNFKCVRFELCVIYCLVLL